MTTTPSGDTPGSPPASTSGGTPTGGTPNDGSLNKDPDNWATGDEPATASQRSYLETLGNDTGQEIPANLTKAEASKLIDELQGKSPRVSGYDTSSG